MKGVAGKEVIFVLGGPGSGKGTISKKLAAKYGFGYAAAGDLLRAEAANPDSANGKTIKEIIEAGKIVPPELLNSTIKNAIASSEFKYFLMDGFPRSLSQDEGFRRDAGTCTACFMLVAPDEVLIQRLTKRGETSGRSDDNASVIPKRLASYYEETLPVLNYYEKEGLLVKINSNQGIAETEQEFTDALRKYWTF